MKSKGLFVIMLLAIGLIYLAGFNSLLLKPSEDSLKSGNNALKKVVLSLLKTPLLQNDDIELNNILDQLGKTGKIKRITVTGGSGRIIADTLPETLGIIFSPASGIEGLEIVSGKNTWLLYADLQESSELKNLKKAGLFSLFFILLTPLLFLLLPVRKQELTDTTNAAKPERKEYVKLLSFLEKQKQGKSLLVLDSGNRVVFAGKALEDKAGMSLTGKKLFELSIYSEVLEKLGNPENIMELGEKKFIIV
ncbi:MAG: hypothetical protein WCI43_03845 [Candidatus Firestonebacteria bacterium]